VPISAAGYVKDLGDFTYRRLSEKSFSFVPEIWKDGFAEFAHVVEAPDFIGWQQEPRNMAAAAANLHQQLISAQLELNSFTGPASTTTIDGVNFFASTHPFHLNDSTVGTFSNNFTGAGTDLTPANVGKARQRFRQILGPNGLPLGIRLKGILVPAGLEETMKRIAQQDSCPGRACRAPPSPARSRSAR
jgi:phage major head subunit gpT-like protein